MPAGTCDLCGCTEDHACEGGCAWADDARQFCTQCVGWLLLGERNPIPGVFAHNLVPVRDLHPLPFPGPFGGPSKLGVRLDMRRLDRETIERLAYFAAPDNGGTVEEFLAEVEQSKTGFVIPLAGTARIFAAKSLEEAFGLVEGTRKGRASVSVACLLSTTKGGNRHG